MFGETKNKKVIIFTMYIAIFFLFSLVIMGTTEDRDGVQPQEKAKFELRVRNAKKVQRYEVRFSTKEKRDNFLILSSEKDAPI